MHNASPPPSTRERSSPEQHAATANRAALLLPDDTAPAFSIAGALLFGYLEVTDNGLTLQVTIDLDDVGPELRTGADEQVPLDVRIGTRIIFDHQRGLPVAGAPVLISTEHGHAYWLDGPALMCAPLHTTGLIGWHTATEVDPDRTDPDLRDAHRGIAQALHTANDRLD